MARSITPENEVEFSHVIHQRWRPMTRVDLSFATSQPEFLPTLVGKLWKAMNANQKQIATVGYNVHKYSNIVLILLKTNKLREVLYW